MLYITYYILKNFKNNVSKLTINKLYVNKRATIVLFLEKIARTKCKFRDFYPT